MLTKGEFKRYVGSYLKFEDYLNKLSDLNINIWERPDVGFFQDNYIRELSLLMDLEVDTKHGNDLELFLYDSCGQISEDDLDWFYDNLEKSHLSNIPNKFYSVEDENDKMKKYLDEYNREVDKSRSRQVTLDDIFEELLERL